MSISLSQSTLGTLNYRYTYNPDGLNSVVMNELIDLTWTRSWGLHENTDNDDDEVKKDHESHTGLIALFNQKLHELSNSIKLRFSGTIKYNKRTFTFANWNIQHLSCYTLNSYTTTLIHTLHPHLFLSISEFQATNISQNPLGILIRLGRNLNVNNVNLDTPEVDLNLSEVIPTPQNKISFKIERIIRHVLNSIHPPLIIPSSSEDSISMIQQITYLGSSTLLQPVLKHITDLHTETITATLTIAVPSFSASLHTLVLSYLPVIPVSGVIHAVNFVARLPLTNYTPHPYTKRLTPLACAVFGENTPGSLGKKHTLDLNSQRSHMVRLLLEAKANISASFEFDHINLFTTNSTENDQNTKVKSLIEFESWSKRSFLERSRDSSIFDVGTYDERFNNLKKLIAEQ